MEDIIESFEKWWLNELDTYHQKGFWKKVRIDETRGTNIKDIGIIISKVKELLRTYEGIQFRKINGYNEIITKRIDFSMIMFFSKTLISYYVLTIILQILNSKVHIFFQRRDMITKPIP